MGGLTAVGGAAAGTTGFFSASPLAAWGGAGAAVEAAGPGAGAGAGSVDGPGVEVFDEVALDASVDEASSAAAAAALTLAAAAASSSIFCIALASKTSPV